MKRCAAAWALFAAALVFDWWVRKANSALSLITLLIQPGSDYGAEYPHGRIP